MLEVLNSAPMYLICGLIILFVALVCVVFMVRAYKAGIAIGMHGLNENIETNCLPGCVQFYQNLIKNLK